MKAIQLILALVLTFGLGLGLDPLYAASKTDTKETGKTSTTASTKSVAKSININSADKEALQQIPGIGPVTADAILEYRKANGKFKSLSDLTKVKGIGEKTMTKLKAYIKI